MSKDRIASPYIVTWMGLVPGFEMITLRHWWRSQKARAVGLAEAALGLVGQHAELLTGTEMPFQIRIESVSITPRISAMSDCRAWCLTKGRTEYGQHV